MNYTLITGATGFLGKAYIHACAKRGENLFLTARQEENLKILTSEIKSQYGVEVDFFPCQLQDEFSRKELYDYIEKKGISFSRLINVAGVDIQKAFSEYSEEKIILQTRVNFESAISLTRFVLSHRAEKAEILTVSSVSGIYPMPYFALYSATKRALVQFFSALRVELKGQGVKVTTVLPGGMPTRKDVCEQIKGQGLWGKIATKSPAYVAEKSLRAVGKNKRVYIPGLVNKLMAFFTKPIPLSWKMHFIAKRWSKISKDAF